MTAAGEPSTVEPSTVDENWGGRLPLVRTGPLRDEQLAWEAELRSEVVPWARRSGVHAATVEGDLIGPFNAFVHQPVPGRAFMAWVRADQAQSSLSAAVREIVVLTVGVAWQSEYEIYVHSALARDAGVPEPVIAAVLAGEPAEQFSAAEAAAYRFADELVRTRRVCDETYRLALDAIGRTGVLDLVHLIGIYLATSALLNAFLVPAPPAAGSAGRRIEPS